MNNTVPTLTPEEFARNFAEIHPPFTRQEAVVEATRCLFCYDAPCTNAYSWGQTGHARRRGQWTEPWSWRRPPVPSSPF